MKAWAKASAAAMKHLCPKKPTAIKRDDYKSPEDQVRVKKQCRMRTAVIWHILCDHRRAASHNLVDCRKQPVNLQRTMLGKHCQPHCGDIRGIRIAMGRRDFHHDVALVEFPSQMFEIDGPAQRDDGDRTIIDSKAQPSQSAPKMQHIALKIRAHLRLRL